MEQSERANPKSEVISIDLRDAQSIEGLVIRFVNADSSNVKLTQEDKGIRVRGKKTNKLVPFSNIRSIDYLEEGQPRPVVPRK